MSRASGDSAVATRCSAVVRAGSGEGGTGGLGQNTVYERPRARVVAAIGLERRGRGV